MTEAEPVRVLVVDDQAPFRLAARAVLRRTSGFELVGEASSGEEAVTKACELRPRLVLMDIKMPGINGLEATRQILAAEPSTIVFLFSTYTRDDLPPEAADSGARAYVNKEELAPGVIEALWARRDEVAGLLSA